MLSHNANEKYFLLNQSLSEKYFNDEYKVRCYQNAEMALFDIALGLQFFLSHKDHFAVAKNGSALIQTLSPLWIRHVNPLQIKNENQNWTEFIQNLNSETNFVVWASENEITGEVLVQPQQALEIHQLLSHKKIYSIQICHSFDVKEKLYPFAVKILKPSLFKNQSSFVIHSQRFKAPSQIGAFQELNQVENDLERFFEKKSDHFQHLIMKSELKISNEKNIYFNRFVSTTARLEDRIVLSYSEVNAYALQKELSLSEDLCFAPSKYPFWILNHWKNWWAEAESQVLIRGLMVISVHALQQDPDLILRINAAVDEFKRLGQINTL